MLWSPRATLHAIVLAIAVAVAVVTGIGARRHDAADRPIQQFLAQSESQPAYRAARRLEAENGSRRGWLDAVTQTIAWGAVFFVASAAASSAYLTVSELFPVELRGLAIAVFYAVGTLAGAAAPTLFGAIVDSGEPERLFAGFEGVLQTDGYEGYTAVGAQHGIVHVGCFAHARRKFDEALKGLPAAQRKGKPASVALAGMGFFQRLYGIERIAKDASAEERQRLRAERSRPIFAAMRTWLDEMLPRVAPQTLTGKALAYLDRQWPKLAPILDDGRIPLDTNLVENAIRPFVLGRKNWLFADTVRGAQASANLYSVIETAKANALEPYAYLRLLFTELPRAQTLADFEPLLPRNVDRDRLHGSRQGPAGT